MSGRADTALVISKGEDEWLLVAEAGRPRLLGRAWPKACNRQQRSRWGWMTGTRVSVAP
jgi:hypothetical protein